ncbi:MAG: protein phosphatase 2C domain-containing protein [Hamadaea sp.]|uniref:protein phosphatase 2C domain-containing protein n=1 Tax=Hamadaea sp. TaxID=2024425 RepID=UPI0017FFAF0A|nr:protein phosphatase 2C domain-containing protein [Hamadaea sp.]NUT22423.1 protein phosphatase 2C domain-containing protein [Hamadaea sp.]
MRWAGADEAYLDEPSAVTAGRMVLGRYGGRTDAGADKNEDAALLLQGEDWELAVVADGHGGADSAAFLIELLHDDPDLVDIMSRPAADALSVVRTHMVKRMRAAELDHLRGEAAVLLVARKDRYAVWLNVGDNLAFVLHPELARLGQRTLNQRSFYEWVGRVDSLRLDVPSHATGVHALRPGRTRIALVTDGVLDFFADPYDGPLGTAVAQLMQRVHDGRGVDSATVVAWDVVAGETPMHPSA